MQEDERRMYELEYPAPDVSGESAKGLTLIVALQGYADAGHAVEESAAHLKAALDTRPVASFNSDELIDFRSRRPSVTIEHNQLVDIDSTSIEMSVARDSRGKSFLLLSGPEPDLRWEGFTQAVADLADRFQVDNTVFLYAAPMTVPHTRPMVISAHGNSHELLKDMFTFDSKVILPGSATLMIERELHRRGHNVAGYTAHVPHYLAGSLYPEATLNLLDSVARATGLEFPLGALEQDIVKVNEQLAEQVAESMEIQQVVAHLEAAYDDEVERYRNRHPQAILPGESQVPTGEELGQEFERFLASLDDEESKDDGEDGHGPHGRSE